MIVQLVESPHVLFLYVLKATTSISLLNSKLSFITVSPSDPKLREHKHFGSNVSFTRRSNHLRQTQTVPTPLDFGPCNQYRCILSNKYVIYNLKEKCLKQTLKVKGTNRRSIYSLELINLSVHTDKKWRARLFT